MPDQGRQNVFQDIPLFFQAAVIFVNGMSVASYADDTIPAPGIYSRLEAFHGHICAGSLFGARLGQAAKDALKAPGGTGKLTAIYYDLSCPVDGIQIAAGTTYGNKALTVNDRDQHRLILTAEGNKKSVEARLTKKAEALSLKSADLKKKLKTLPARSQDRLTLEREVEDIYSWLMTAPTADVVEVTVKGSGKAR